MDVLGLVRRNHGSGSRGRRRNVEVGADGGAGAVRFKAIGVPSASGVLEAAAELRPVVVEPLQLAAVAQAVIVGHAAPFFDRHCTEGGQGSSACRSCIASSCVPASFIFNSYHNLIFMQ